MKLIMSKKSAYELEILGQSVANHVDLWLKNKPVGFSSAYFVNFAAEINTKHLEKVLIKHHAQIYVPLITADELIFVEPGKNQPQKLSQIDVIFVPGLSFDKNGHRLGRGKGHYDKALAKFLTGEMPILVGLATDEQVVKNVPHEPHDVAMDFICTPLLGMLATNQRD